MFRAADMRAVPLLLWRIGRKGGRRGAHKHDRMVLACIHFRCQNVQEAPDGSVGARNWNRRHFFNCIAPKCAH